MSYYAIWYHTSMRRSITRLLATRHQQQRCATFGPGLHEYTSGRYLFNEKQRLRERHLDFSVSELANTVCSAVKKSLDELVDIEKFSEGGFNRMLQATFIDGKEILIRFPFRLEAPLRYSVASEAATLSFLRHRGLPVPELLGYSATADNPSGIEYILLEKLSGRSLGERWFSLENESIAKVMKQIVEVEKELMSINLPASGSLYFAKDLSKDERTVPISQSASLGDEIVLGPIASYAWQYRQRSHLKGDRGPWQDFLACFEAGAKRELAFCKNYGKPRLNVERYLRELDDFQPQLPSHHVELLHEFLKMAPFLNLPADVRFARPTLRHPDLSPNNILINDQNEVTGIIDWQHAAILPLSLCAGIPQHYQNWGDPVSESLQKPSTTLPPDFESLAPAEQEEIKEIMRRRLVHFHYAALSLKKNEDHFDAFRSQNSMLRAKLYARTSAPWEASSLDLEHALIQAQQHWPLVHDEPSSLASAECPVKYTSERIELCLKRMKDQEEKLDELEDMRGMLGTDATGWVADDDHLAQAQEMREAIRSAFLKECETEAEKKATLEHFAFDDRDEEE